MKHCSVAIIPPTDIGKKVLKKDPGTFLSTFLCLHKMFLSGRMKEVLPNGRSMRRKAAKVAGNGSEDNV